MKVKNYGSDDQDYMVIELENVDLGIEESESFSLDRGYDSNNDETITFNIETDNDAEEGSYRLTVKAFYDYTVYGDIEYLDFTIDDCSTESETTTASTIVNNSNEVTSTNDNSSDEESNNGELTDNSSSSNLTVTASDSDSSIITTTLSTEYDQVETIEKRYSSDEVGAALTLVLLSLIVISVIALLVLASRRTRIKRK